MVGTSEASLTTVYYSKSYDWKTFKHATMLKLNMMLRRNV